MELAKLMNQVEKYLQSLANNGEYNPDNRALSLLENILAAYNREVNNVN